MNWLYKGQEVLGIDDMPQGAIGFIYQIEHTPTGRRYIGRKQLGTQKKRKFGKKEIALLTDKRLKHWEYVIVESDWKIYYGSNKEIQAMVKKGLQEEFSREILMYVFSKKLLNYYETKMLFINEVIEPGSTYFNDNISSHFFRRDFE